MIPAKEAIKAINDHRDDAVVVSIMTPNLYWEAVSNNPDLDIPIFGGMGKASSVALGLALARPDRKVILLDGDGSLLMNLGTLVTIAGKAPENLVHFVFEDGVYMTTGGQPVPAVGSFSLAGMAKEAGIGESHEFADLEEFVSELPGLLSRRGPVFASLRVHHVGEVPQMRMGSTGAAMRRVAAKLREE